eukprot:55806-Eustigmatos_ZCMA.PRE.1
MATAITSGVRDLGRAAMDITRATDICSSIKPLMETPKDRQAYRATVAVTSQGRYSHPGKGKALPVNPNSDNPPTNQGVVGHG